MVANRKTSRPICLRVVNLVIGGPLHAVDDDDLRRGLLHFQLEPELSIASDNPRARMVAFPTQGEIVVTLKSRLIHNQAA